MTSSTGPTGGQVPSDPKPAVGIDYDAIAKAAWTAHGVAIMGDDWTPADPWEKLDPESVDTWTAAGRAAVEAYDAQLGVQADRKAEEALNVAQAATQADADAILSQAENPADAFAKAKAIEDAQASQNGGEGA